jgi:type I restriction enzyme R subunit
MLPVDRHTRTGRANALEASEDLSAQILNNSELSQKLLGELVPIIYKGLKAAG